MWSEPDSVAYTESVGHLVDHLGSVHIVEEGLNESLGDPGPVRRGSGASSRREGEQDQDIVQCSTSEQAPFSLSIWYSIFV